MTTSHLLGRLLKTPISSNPKASLSSEEREYSFVPPDRFKYSHFDELLANGVDCVDDFVWDIKSASSLCVLDIKDWRGCCHGLPSKGPDRDVVERRTKLWKMVLVQELLAADTSDVQTIPFTVPSTPNTRKIPYTLTPSHTVSLLPQAIPFQRIHVSPYAIPTDLADMCAASASAMLEHLNSIFGTSVPFSSELKRHFTSCIPLDWDVGTVYGHLRPWWSGFVSGEYGFWEMDTFMGDRRVEDMSLRHRDTLGSGRWALPSSFRYRRHTNDRIVNVEIPPRRVWDLYSNRVLPFSILKTAGVTVIPENVWAVSHSWVAASERREVWTSINGKQWPVSLPIGVNLDQLRIELLNMGAEYVFLDVLCLRQQGDKNKEEIRRDEWELDIPTLGHVYRHDRYQTVVVYFNGLGRAFDLRRDVLESPLHWFNRAWTLQETPINWLPGGLALSSYREWDGERFTRRMLESQRSLGLSGGSTKNPNFADLLHAMHQRPGYANKKPYDRVAALSYLLPQHQPAVYVERWSNAEEAWSWLIRSLSASEKLDLLLYERPREENPSQLSAFRIPSSWRSLTRIKSYSTKPKSSRVNPSWMRSIGALEPPQPEEGRLNSMPNDLRSDALQPLHESWHPSWEEIMRHPENVGSSSLSYDKEDILREWASGSGFFTRRWDYHLPYVLKECRQARRGKVDVSLPSSGQPKQVRIDFDEELWDILPVNEPFCLMGVAKLEYWVVGRIDGRIEIDDGHLALEVTKVAVFRIADEKRRFKLQDICKGQRQFVAYRN